MPLTKGNERKARAKAISIRLSEESVAELKALASVYNQSQADIIETLVHDALKAAEKKYSSEIKKALRGATAKK